MLCFDLMEMVGKDVVKKREQDTLDYWTEITFSQVLSDGEPVSLANRFGICHAFCVITEEAEDLGGLTILQTMKQDALQLGLLDLDPDQYFGSLAFRKHVAREEG